VPALVAGQTINIMKYHDMLGHFSEAKTKKTAKYYDIKLSGNFEVCSDCAKAKARQKNIPKGNDTVHAESKGERLSFDISGIKSKSYGGAKFWLLVVDDKTDYSWGYFLKTKDETKGIMTALIKDLKERHKITVKKLRCDNAGENLDTQDWDFRSPKVEESIL
jgi:hypothetical protein